MSCSATHGASRSWRRLARDAGGRARAGTPAEAARDADALLLAVHWDNVDNALRQAGDLSGKVIVTCSLPMNSDDSGLVIGQTSSGAETLAGKVPGSHVVAAFNTLPSEVLFAVFDRRHDASRPSVVYYGDHQPAKDVAATLIRDVGFDPVDAGPLRIARYAEPFALLMGQLAYEGEGGPEIAYRFERFGDA